MRELKITQDQYNELCCAGKLAFVNHTVYAIKVLTWFEMLAVSMDINDKGYDLVKVVVE